MRANSDLVIFEIEYPLNITNFVCIQLLFWRCLVAPTEGEVSWKEPSLMESPREKVQNLFPTIEPKLYGVVLSSFFSSKSLINSFVLFILIFKFDDQIVSHLSAVLLTYWRVACQCGAKGQLILEGNFGVFKSPKKWTFVDRFLPYPFYRLGQKSVKKSYTKL